MEIKAELRPHIGKQQSGLGVIDHDNGQWMVFVTSTEMHPGQLGSVERPLLVGYLPYDHYSKFLPLPTYSEKPPEVQTMIMDAINIAVAEKDPNAPPREQGIKPLLPEVAEAVLGPEDDDEDEDDDGEEDDVE